MADILIDNQSTPTTPASGKSVLWIDSTSKKLAQTDDAGHHYGLLSACFSASGVASQALTSATDTYVTSSGILIPGCGIQVGQSYRWYIALLKSAAGTGTMTTVIRLGSAQTISDTVVVTFTIGTAQTATAIGALYMVTAQVRTASASGIIVGTANGLPTALGSGGTIGAVTGISGSLDLTARAGQFMGISINSGTGDTFTVDSVRGELIG